MKMRKWCALGALLLLLGSGCSKENTQSAGKISGGSTGVNGFAVAMSGRIEITGDDKVSGTFRNNKYTFQKSCNDVVNHGSGGSGFGRAGSFQVPGPYFSTPINGVEINHHMTIDSLNYTGAGTYDLGKWGVLNDTAIVIGFMSTGKQYIAKEGSSSGSLQLNEDGSGLLSFAALETRNGETISGTITWSCED